MEGVRRIRKGKRVEGDLALTKQLDGSVTRMIERVATQAAASPRAVAQRTQTYPSHTRHSREGVRTSG